MTRHKPNGCHNGPPIPAKPTQWAQGRGYCVDVGPYDPRCALCDWRGVGRVFPPPPTKPYPQEIGELRAVLAYSEGKCAF